MKKVLHRLVLGLVVAVVCLAAGELTLRAFYCRIGNYNMEMWRYASDLKQPLDRPRLPFHHFPNKQGTYYGADICLNSLGFRGSECELDKPAATKRVVFLGDSFTLGWGVVLDETFSRQVETMLRGAGIACDVINMGIGNYNTTMEVELFKWKGLRLDPDLVVLAYFINDTEPIPGRKSDLAYWIMKRSYLFAFLFDRFIRLRATTSRRAEWEVYYRKLYSSENADNLAMNTRSVHELIDLCNENHISLLIANVPELHGFEDYRFSYATEYIKGLAQDADVPFIDLLVPFSEYVAESLWVSPDDPHANARAHAVIAREIGNVIVKDGLLR